MTIAPHTVMTALLSVLLIAPAPQTPEHTACPRCRWQAPSGGRIVDVRSVEELHRAVAQAKPGDTILLADGQYALQRMIEIATPNVTVRSHSGDPDRVIVHGRGMAGDNVGVGIAVSASHVTVADVTIRAVGYHAVQIRGERGVVSFTLHNAKLYDAGQQLLKGSFANNGMFAYNGLVACSEFGYTTSAPSGYTNGVDLLGTRGWVIRDNRFFRIRGPAAQGWRSGPTILVWQGAQDTLVERNLIVDSFRGIALGLTAGYGNLPYDHLRGIVRNNVVINLNGWADEAIEANGARDARIEHNTVLVEGSVPWSIGVRFASSTAWVRNNLTSGPTLERDGGVAIQGGNVATALAVWFVDPARYDLHLRATALRAIDVGVPIDDVTSDFDRVARPVGRGPDAGAFEFPPGRSAVK